MPDGLDDDFVVRPIEGRDNTIVAQPKAIEPLENSLERLSQGYVKTISFLFNKLPISISILETLLLRSNSQSAPPFCPVLQREADYAFPF